VLSSSVCQVLAAELSKVARVGRAWRALPQNVRALGWVSFANDLSSELAYPIVPLFLTVTLGAPVKVLGLIEGIAEGIALGLRGVAGWLSDRMGERRVPWIFGGYGLSALSRPVLAAAPGWGWVLTARIADRLGKGARTAPRDALIRDSSPPELVGASFGYHRAMDSLGAVLGPLAAVAMLEAHLSLRTILYIAVIPGILAVALVAFIKEAKRPEPVQEIEPQRALSLPREFWFVLGTWTVFSLGNSSDAFLILRSRNLGLGLTLVVLSYALYQFVYSSFSWPLGALSDRIPRPIILAAGLVIFALVYLGFAVAPGSWAVWPLFAVYGAYIAATDGVAKAWIADQVPGRAAGAAYGVFAAVTGLALVVASGVAGLLWSYVSPKAPFLLGAGSAVVALVLLLATGTGRRSVSLSAKR
jgi:MFS family permease